MFGGLSPSPLVATMGKITIQNNFMNDYSLLIISYIL